MLYECHSIREYYQEIANALHDDVFPTHRRVSGARNVPSQVADCYAVRCRPTV